MVNSIACSAHSTDVAWSCVVDDTPKIWVCLIPWLATVAPLGRIGGSQIHIHHVCDLRPAVLHICRDLGVQLHRVTPFDHRAPELNKIRQCATCFESISHVVLTDVDVVFNEAVPIHQLEREISGKCVDHPNPDIQVLRSIFSEFGLRHPDIVTCSYKNAAGQDILFDTFAANFNGGVYIVQKAIRRDVGERWSYWANRLLDQRHLLRRWQRHIDQVSFCLAVNELGLNLEMLDARWNYPLHLPNPTNTVDPFILHHHGLLTDTTLLQECKDSVLQHRLSSINRIVSQFTSGLCG